MSRTGHLTRRFVGTMRPGGPRPADTEWVREVLETGEFTLWSKMPNHDRRHSVLVAHRVADQLSTTEYSGDSRWLAAALLHDVGRSRELRRGPSFRQTEEGRLLGHVHLGLRLIEERSQLLEPEVLAELLHAIACHHDRQAARTAEAAVLYHANQLDAQAATRPVGDD